MIELHIDGSVQMNVQIVENSWAFHFFLNSYYFHFIDQKIEAQRD